MSQRACRFALRALFGLAARPLLLALCMLLGAASAALAEVDISLPQADPRDPVFIRGRSASTWQQGMYEVWLLEGGCEIRQGDIRAACGDAVFWIDRAGPDERRPTKIIAYLEGDPESERPVAIEIAATDDERDEGRPAPQSLVDRTWFGRFFTTAEIFIDTPLAAAEPQVKPAVFHRGMQARQPVLDPSVTRAQFLPENIVPPAASSAPAGPGRTIQILQRGAVGYNINFEPDANLNESRAIITGGFRILINDVQIDQIGAAGQVVIEADNAVLWAAGAIGPEIVGGSVRVENLRPEFYLEGNIVFNQGNRVIYAKRMYYNVMGEYGVILDAEMLTPVPQYQGLLRLKADILQQLDKQNYQALGAAITSSRMGVPRYWLQSESVAFQDNQIPIYDPVTNLPAIDPQTGEPVIEHELLATSNNNFLYAGGWPVLYWPVFSADLQDPTFYIDELSVRNDSIFGFQVLADFNAYQVLGIDQPLEGTDWTFSTDYLSERGPAVGTRFDYDRDIFHGIPGVNRGFFDAWGIKDDGLDDLGANRRSVPLEKEYRGRVLWNHRHYLPYGWQLTAEAGVISDRNFLEQYFETEWDTYKDQTTGFELKRLVENQSWNLSADIRVNDFFTQTDRLPRVDHFLIGQSLLWDHLTWHAHSRAGYERLRRLDPPDNPVDASMFSFLPWEADREGLVASTRQEIDLPFSLGPVKFTPYVLGEAAFWGEDLSGDDYTRLLGQTGVRASMPFWSANPEVQSVLFNVNGLAHKVVLEGEVLYADADRDLTDLPLYEPLDDDVTEHTLRNYYTNSFGMMGGTAIVPAKLDPRLFALRSGTQRWVTSSNPEIADDLMLARVGLRQRWQTKRGLPGRERITDWIVFDIEGVLFPKPGRDNFGEDIGLVDYDFRWHVGDRLTLLSDGFVDFFDDGLRTFTVGGLIGRPERGNLYVGFRSIEGPITASVLSASVNYRMSEKWIFTGGASVDLGPTGNIGQTVAITRIGESALVQLGFNVDEGRDNIGVRLSIEPRFLPNRRLGRVHGVQIAPAGAFGLE